jgi:hypothetical protein
MIGERWEDLVHSVDFRIDRQQISSPAIQQRQSRSVSQEHDSALRRELQSNL